MRYGCAGPSEGRDKRLRKLEFDGLKVGDTPRTAPRLRCYTGFAKAAVHSAPRSALSRRRIRQVTLNSPSGGRDPLYVAAALKKLLGVRQTSIRRTRIRMV